MPVVKAIDYNGVAQELSKSLNVLPEMVERFEKTVSNIKTLSSVFADNKNQLLYMEEQNSADIKNYEIKTKNQSLEFLTEEIKKFNRIIVHKSMLDDLEEKCAKLQKYIDSELENEKKLLQKKYEEDLDNKMTICKIIAEKDKMQCALKLENKEFEINFLKDIISKNELLATKNKESDNNE